MVVMRAAGLTAPAHTVTAIMADQRLTPVVWTIRPRSSLVHFTTGRSMTVTRPAFRTDWNGLLGTDVIAARLCAHVTS